MNTATQSMGRVEEFPPAARAYLQAFYQAKNVAGGDSHVKIEALREGHGLKDAVIAADNDIADEAEELRILEFYVLTKRGII